jgi:NAD(P)-dependent dehydrogenase (short-subunit alcohol dehydrogenase family)
MLVVSLGSRPPAGRHAGRHDGRGLGTTEAPDAFLDLHPIRCIAKREEVAATVAVLAGPEARYITGGVIDVAGEFGI